MEAFETVKIDAFMENPFTLIGKQWMLITAEKDGKVNTMTASWGGLGEIWGQSAAYIVVRPQRYTKEFLDAADTFSLTFFEESYRKTLSYLGTVSGREEDKIAKSGLTIAHCGDTPYYEEAEKVLICKKAFAQPMVEQSFLDRALIEKWYEEKDYHILYIGLVEKVMYRQK